MSVPWTCRYQGLVELTPQAQGDYITVIEADATVAAFEARIEGKVARYAQF